MEVIEQIVDGHSQIKYISENLTRKNMIVSQNNIGENVKVYTIEAVGSRCIKIYVDSNAYKGGKVVITNTNFLYNAGEVISDLMERKLELVKHYEGGFYTIEKYKDDHTKPDVFNEKFAIQDTSCELYFKIINDFLNEKINGESVEYFRDAFNIVLPLVFEDLEKIYAKSNNSKTI